MDDVDSEAAQMKYQCLEKYEVSYPHKALFLLQQSVSTKCPLDDYIKTGPPTHKTKPHRLYPSSIF